MQEIKLNLAVDDVNLILEGLGNLPFARVYTLVAKLQEQAAQQINSANAAAQPVPKASKTPAAQ
ncbi:MAG: hypothetical protein ACKVP5_24175 [Aestuariivirga sp.]